MKVKLSNIVENQLSNVISTDYPIFSDFISTYYKFLDESKINRNLEEFRDIDKTHGQFITNLHNELAVISPNYADNRFYIPLLKQHFITRGSEDSYNLLFRLLFNIDIEIQYPAESVIKVSDGKWYQDNCIFVKLIDGNINNLKNKYVYVNTPKQKIRIYVERINVYNESNSIYQLFISKFFYGTLLVNATIDFEDVQCKLLKTTNSVKIINGGKKFKPNQYFEINTGFGSGSIIRIVKVGFEGVILEVQLIEFGVGYTKPFSFTLFNILDIAQDNPIYQGGIITHNDNQTIKSEGYIEKHDYADSQVMNNDYVGTIEGYFFSDNQILDTNNATLYFNTGVLARYPGYYVTTDSFISGDSYIHDGEYYQDFSYVIKSEKSIKDYRNFVNKMCHPTGRKLFSEYLINNSFVVEPERSISKIRLYYDDEFELSDFSNREIIKQPKDSIDFEEVLSKSMTYLKQDTILFQSKLRIKFNAYDSEMYFNIEENPYTLDTITIGAN